MRLDKLAALSVALGTLVASSSAGQVAPDRHVLWRLCEEDALVLTAEAAPLAERVGESNALAVVDGKAQLGILLQVCPEYRIDGKDLGLTHDLHVLVRLEAEPRVDPVVGAQVTRPTLRWFHLFAGSSNPRVREAWTASGRPGEPIGEIVLPSRDGGAGTVEIGGRRALSWTSTSRTTDPLVVGVNHEIESTDVNGQKLLNRVQALAWAVPSLGSGTLEVQGDSALSKLIGIGSHSVRVFSPRPMRARATVGRVSTEP